MFLDSLDIEDFGDNAEIVAAFKKDPAGSYANCIKGGTQKILCEMARNEASSQLAKESRQAPAGVQIPVAMGQGFLADHAGLIIGGLALVGIGAFLLLRKK